LHFGKYIDRHEKRIRIPQNVRGGFGHGGRGSVAPARQRPGLGMEDADGRPDIGVRTGDAAVEADREEVESPAAPTDAAPG